MGLNGSFGDDQCIGNQLIRVSLRNQDRNFTFAYGQSTKHLFGATTLRQGVHSRKQSTGLVQEIVSKGLIWNSSCELLDERSSVCKRFFCLGFTPLRLVEISQSDINTP